MNTLITLLAQTKYEAIIEILALLIVAAVISFVTARFYYNSVSTKRIKFFNSETAKLKNQHTSLEMDYGKIQKSLYEKDNEIKYLIKEMNTLKEQNTEDVNKTGYKALKNKRSGQVQYEKEKHLTIIDQQKHFLDYNSFGRAHESNKDDLKMISGIGPFIEERLHELDIYTLNQISKFTATDIRTIDEAIEFFSGRIERDEWVTQAKELIEVENRMTLLTKIRERKSRIYFNRIGLAKKEEADDLTTISGIGGWIKEKLYALGIYTFRQVANFNKEDVNVVTEAIEYFPGRIERDEWIYQAKELIRKAIHKSELLKHISDRKDRIYFDRLGMAHKHQANNLTLIKGISPWIEERLNVLDLFTFKQISRLSSSDVKTISEILEISAVRIENDEWVKQAGLLDKKIIDPVKYLINLT